MHYTDEELREVKAVLKNDDQYYGDYGRQFLSNSDVSTLLYDPKEFRKPLEQTKAMIQGRYFHTAMLEPQKLDLYEVIDMASRNTKIYKDAIAESGEEILLLTKEQEECMLWVSKMKENIRFFDDIYEPGNKYEVPGVELIQGVWWKGKADIITKDYIIDLKTTADIYKFGWSARKYNYDSQCYIYQQIFGKPLVFYCIDKSTGVLGIFSPDDPFIQGGRDKVMRALEQYEKFYGEKATEDPAHFIIEGTLI